VSSTFQRDSEKQLVLGPERRKALTAKAEALAADVAEVLPYLEARGITDEAADLFGLGYASEGQYAGRMSIPYITPNGVIQIKYRCLDTSHEIDGKHDCSAKYIGETGCGSVLFNARALIGAGDIVVLTEGEMDAISVQSATELPSVGYPGVSSWKTFYRLCFEGIREILVVADGDEPGRKAASQIAEKLGMSARVVDLGDGYDSNTFITEFGPDKFIERLRS
jgi:DNA primase